MKRTLLAVAALALLALSAPAVSAHAYPEGMDPAHGAVLVASPVEVRTGLTQPAVPETVRIHLLDAGGTEATLGTPEVDGETVRVAVEEALRDGTWFVHWSWTSAADGHDTSGRWAFVVGSPDAAVGAASAGDDVGALERVVHVVGVVGLALLAGASAWRSFVRDAPSVHRLGVAGTGILAVSLAAGSLGPWSDRVAVAVAAVGMAFVTRRDPRWSLGCAAAAALAWASASHAAGSHGAAGTVVSAVHGLAASAWVVGVGLLAASRDPSVLPRFHRLALGSVALLLLAGAVEAAWWWQESGSWSAYGRTLAGKGALFVAAGVLGAWNLRRLRAGAGARGSLRAEASVLGVALLAGAVLATLPPGAPAPVEPSLPAADAVWHADGQRYHYVLSASPGPTASAASGWRLQVLDPALNAGVHGDAVLVFTGPDGAAYNVTLEGATPGRYEAHGAFTPEPGPWGVEVVFRSPEVFQDGIQVGFEVPA